MSVKELDNDFVPHEVAIILAEIGFDGRCFTSWGIQTRNEDGELTPDEPIMIPIPTYHQAFRWFRYKYDLQYWIHDGGYLGKCCIKITGYKHDKFYFSSSEPMEYEEAELACLRKLIKIVKNK